MKVSEFLRPTTRGKKGCGPRSKKTYRAWRRMDAKIWYRAFKKANPTDYNDIVQGAAV